MYCKNCGKPMNDNQAICLNCGVNAGCGNKFCANCGEPVNESAAVCTHCGVAIKKIAQPQSGAVLSKEEAYKKLAEYEKTAAIIWFVIAALQIIGGIFTYYTPVLVGCWNIYTGVQRIKHSKTLADMPAGIYEYYEKQGTANIIFLVVNIILGGLIGGIASGYDIYIRSFVMKNKEIFE